MNRLAAGTVRNIATGRSRWSPVEPIGGSFIVAIVVNPALADGRDATAGIQAAIDAAVAAGGGTVLVPEGTYRTSRTLDLP